MHLTRGASPDMSNQGSPYVVSQHTKIRFLGSSVRSLGGCTETFGFGGQSPDSRQTFRFVRVVSKVIRGLAENGRFRRAVPRQPPELQIS